MKKKNENNYSNAPFLCPLVTYVQTSRVAQYYILLGYNAA
jgi:hypothetical protein